jgi:hypothetical protein
LEFNEVAPEIMTISQWVDINSSQEKSPEKRLLWAVLADALCNYNLGTKTRFGKNRFSEAQSWLFETKQSDSICNFESICSIFEIDPDFLRKGILNFKGKLPRANKPVSHSMRIIAESSRPSYLTRRIIRKKRNKGFKQKAW